MNFRIVSRYIGIALLLNAIFMFISAGVSFIYNVDASFSPLLLSGIITAITASFPMIFVNKKEEINVREGLLIVVFSWIFSCFFGMLPYILYGGEFSVINAWFESVSGYTTTGSTILTDVEALPRGLLFWRSSTHFLGGIGVVLFMLLILPTVSTSRMRLSNAEISPLAKENFRFKAKQTIKVISIVYLGLTLIETILLMVAGMDLFDALAHSFATIATGGFSTRNMSVAAFDSYWIELIIMVFMVLGGMHFGLLYIAAIGKPQALFKSQVTRYYLMAMLLGGLLVSINIKMENIVPDWFTAFRQGFFQVATLGTSTGFANADSSVWPGFSILIITFFTMQCACSGSTSGGIKVDRIFILYKAFKSQITKQKHPNAIIPVKLGEQTVDKEIVYSVTLFVAVYIFIVFAVALILTAMGVDTIDAITGSAANMGNAGPGFGKVGSLGNYSSIPSLGKLVLSAEMLLGRLEIYSLLLILVIFRRR